MPAITKPKTREIVEDFAKEIRERRMKTVKPSKAVINFRTEIKDGIEQRRLESAHRHSAYRKDNGRIASDVMDYEQMVGILDEKDDDAQAKIAEFLREKDPEKTNNLRQLIMHDGQRDPAIITCDGFIINGNRRKMVMEDFVGSFLKIRTLPL